MRLLISAAEASSDRHGAELVKALRQLVPASMEFSVFGIGGPELQKAGLNPVVVDARELLTIGFVEVLTQLPRILRALRRATEAAQELKPDLAIVIDYPDFHFRFARRLKALGIPVIYYIPPKVWVWRRRRVYFLRQFFKKILCIFPFEEEFYRQYQVPVSYVGNPLMDQLPLQMTRAQARERLGIAESELSVVLMVGSRRSEWKYHLELFLNAVYRVAMELRQKGQLQAEEKLVVLMPFPEVAPLAELTEKVKNWESTQNKCQNKCEDVLTIRISQGNAAECLVAADAGLVKSGTSTLEAGLLGCPHLVVYKPSRTAEWIFKYLIRYRGPVGLVNLASGWKSGDPYLAPEFLCERATADLISSDLVDLMSSAERRAKMRSGFDRLRLVLGGKKQSPSLAAAREVLSCVEGIQVGQ